MDITIIATICSFIFLVVLWVVVGVRHLKNASKGLENSWEFVDEKIRKRHDLLPVLVEILRGEYGSDKSFLDLVSRMIVVRDESRRIYFSCGDKIEKEYELSKIVGSLLALGEKNEKVGKSTYFLEVKKELVDLSMDIENRARDYNETVRNFNFSRGIFVLRPLSRLLKLKQALIFEFEK